MSRALITRSGCRAARFAPTCPPSEQPDHHGARRVGGIHHCDGVGDEFVGAIGVGPLRTIRQAVAAPIEADDTIAAREIRDLGLPQSRIDDRPGRQQQHGRRPFPEDFEVDPYAIADDVSPSDLARARARSALPSGLLRWRRALFKLADHRPDAAQRTPDGHALLLEAKQQHGFAPKKRIAYQRSDIVRLE